MRGIPLLITLALSQLTTQQVLQFQAARVLYQMFFNTAEPPILSPFRIRVFPKVGKLIFDQMNLYRLDNKLNEVKWVDALY